MKKAFRHMGHDIARGDNVTDARLGVAVKADLPDFFGRAAVLARRRTGPERRLAQSLLEDPEPLVHQNDQILREGEIVGHRTSGNHGHHLGGAAGIGHVPCPGESADEVLVSAHEIDVMGTRVGARAALRPLQDPTHARMRA